ncbi:MAG: hypothetical protein IKW85_04700 [Muribaculaceae bacterium]|nr:hypothetical protein [Muribaculaceae bacterium]
MKRFTLLMAAIICLATAAVAQISEDQKLSTTQWKQGIATCAHYTAHARGFARTIEEIKGKYPQGYTLDDLNDVYSHQGRRWESIYKEFKKNEDKGGSINDLKDLVTPQIWKLVEPEFQAYLTAHPEAAQDTPAQNGDQQADNNNGENQQQEGEGNAATVKADGNSACWNVDANLPLWLSIIGALLGLWALLTALSNRGKIKEMRRNFARELERTNANLQEFSTDAADQMKALSIRLTGKTMRGTEAQPVVAPEVVDAPENETVTLAEGEEPEELVAEVAEEEPEANEEREVMNLFMNKPDEDDNFTRVSDTFEPGNSIYVLTTFDGQHGTFEVIDKPEVHRFALMMPAENLIRACSGNAIQIPNGTRIVTDRPGEAEFIDGLWHVVVKAIIHYEG